jgi:hypothetical protein
MSAVNSSSPKPIICVAPVYQRGESFDAFVRVHLPSAIVFRLETDQDAEPGFMYFSGFTSTSHLNHAVSVAGLSSPTNLTAGSSAAPSMRTSLPRLRPTSPRSPRLSALDRPFFIHCPDFNLDSISFLGRTDCVSLSDTFGQSVSY